MTTANVAGWVKAGGTTPAQQVTACEAVSLASCTVVRPCSHSTRLASRSVPQYQFRADMNRACFLNALHYISDGLGSRMQTRSWAKIAPRATALFPLRNLENADESEMPGVASAWSMMDDSLAINPKALIETWSPCQGRC